jgi:cytochrome c oxidase assembly protein subunit 15
MIVWYIVSARVKGSVLFQATRFIPLTLVLLQIVLGIISVLAANLIVPNRWGLFETIAQVHQLGGLCMILSLTAVLFLVRKEPS